LTNRQAKISQRDSDQYGLKRRSERFRFRVRSRFQFWLCRWY